MLHSYFVDWITGRVCKSCQWYISSSASLWITWNCVPVMRIRGTQWAVEKMLPLRLPVFQTTVTGRSTKKSLPSAIAFNWLWEFLRSECESYRYWVWNVRTSWKFLEFEWIRVAFNKATLNSQYICRYCRTAEECLLTFLLLEHGRVS